MSAYKSKPADVRWARRLAGRAEVDLELNAAGDRVLFVVRFDDLTQQGAADIADAIERAHDRLRDELFAAKLTRRERAAVADLQRRLGVSRSARSLNASIPTIDGAITGWRLRPTTIARLRRSLASLGAS